MKKISNYYINNIKYIVPNNYTLLQILTIQNIDVPRYCYHEKLSIAGNCRMCLVEEDKSLKPLASCAIMTGVGDLKLYTNTEKVKKARESVIEFLLINHPLDCPICDQGGECDLQDQTLVFGSDRGRFYEYRRSVSDKNLGVFIKTSMNRCIHCTRCVRYAEEIAGFSELGIVGRGSKMEISTYVSAFISNELSGNVIDLCPVGALTSKPFSYNSRPWELTSFESIDVFDSLASSIRIDVRGNYLIRILPGLNKDINEDWITDKIRFIYDGLTTQRILNPFLKIGPKYISFSWSKVYYYLKYYFIKELKNCHNLLNFNFLPFVGPIADIESCYLLKKFSNWLGYSNHSLISYISGDKVKQGNDFRSFTFNERVLNLKTHNNIILLIGINLRLEAPLLSLRLKASNKEWGTLLYSISSNFNSTFFIRSLGSTSDIIIQIFKGNHWLCSNLLKNKSYFILSDTTYVNQCNSINFLLNYFNYAPKSPVLDLSVSVLQKFISSVGSLDIGFIGGNHSTANELSRKCNDFNSSFFYLIDVQPRDFVNYLKTFFFNKNCYPFTVYQGSSAFNIKFFQPDIFLPSKSFIEKTSVYFNFTGKLKKTKGFSFSSSSYTRPDWQILSSLLRYLGMRCFFRKKIIIDYITSISPFFINEKNNLVNSLLFSKDFFFINKFERSSFSSLLFYNYFISNTIAENSANLNLAAKHWNYLYVNNFRNF